MKSHFIAMAFTVFASLFAASTGSAALVVDGDFAANPSITDTNENHALVNFADNGWFTKAPLAWAGTTDVTRGNANGAIVQMNTLGAGDTGDGYNLSFDWTADAGATGTALEVYARIVAWDDGGAAATDQAIRFINSNDASGMSALGGGSWVDLSDGSTATGNANAGKFTFAGTAGSTQSASFSLNFGGTDLGDYDFIGLRFDAPPSSLGILDNVAITATAVPEPSSLAFMGIGCLGLILRRRRRGRDEKK